MTMLTITCSCRVNHESTLQRTGAAPAASFPSIELRIGPARVKSSIHSLRTGHDNRGLCAALSNHFAPSWEYKAASGSSDLSEQSAADWAGRAGLGERSQRPTALESGLHGGRITTSAAAKPGMVQLQRNDQ